jgi:hypothetical protein
MRAAVAFLQFECPLGDASDFATRLGVGLCPSAKVVEARAEPEPKAALPPTDPRGPPMVPDRRFRMGLDHPSHSLTIRTGEWRSQA